jgi:threonine/homoserine efflux transporter RhtA
VHRAEAVVVTLGFGAFFVLALLGYHLRSQNLLIAALGVAMISAAAIPLLEYVLLRDWPRYAALPRESESGSDAP